MSWSSLFICSILNGPSGWAAFFLRERFSASSASILAIRAVLTKTAVSFSSADGLSGRDVWGVTDQLAWGVPAGVVNAGVTDLLLLSLFSLSSRNSLSSHLLFALLALGCFFSKVKQIFSQGWFVGRFFRHHLENASSTLENTTWHRSLIAGKHSARHFFFQDH